MCATLLAVLDDRVMLEGDYHRRSMAKLPLVQAPCPPCTSPRRRITPSPCQWTPTSNEPPTQSKKNGAASD